ncbi:MAG: ChbG/HpnK family deacetylase [Chitinophagaceae bacterium]
MKRISLLIYTLFFLINGFAQTTRLIIRADDMGVTHATNIACMDAFTKGVARSVEVMVPTGWFIEAVKMLQTQPGYDAGIHLVLTSEWRTVKWRPLTYAKSLVDSNGYFYPTIWKGSPDFPSLHNNKPDFAEAENELRAQIEMAKKHIPSLSHISTHMGFDNSHPELKKIVQQLSAEYKLPITQQPEVLDFPGTKAMRSDKPGEREAAFIKQLATLEKGKTYLLVTHPCYNTPEMQTVSASSYENVGKDRQADLDMLASNKVKKALEKYNIKLISVQEHFK